MELFQSPYFAFLQDLCQVNQDDQAAVQLCDSRDVVQFTIFKNVRRQVDLRWRNLQHFRGGIDHQANHLSVHFHHKNAVLLVDLDFFFPEALAQVDYRNDLSAQIDDSLDVVWGLRYGGDVRDAHNLMNQRDVHPKGLPSDSEADDMQVFVFGHPKSSEPQL